MADRLLPRVARALGVPLGAQAAITIDFPRQRVTVVYPLTPALEAAILEAGPEPTGRCPHPPERQAATFSGDATCLDCGSPVPRVAARELEE